MPADAAYAPTKQPLAIRKPVALDPNGTVKCETVGVVPPGPMTKMEILTQVALPEQKAAASIIRSAMTARGDQQGDEAHIGAETDLVAVFRPEVIARVSCYDSRSDADAAKELRDL